MAKQVECACLMCAFNGKEGGSYGFCNNPKITLKFRLAGDFGKGTIVFLECLEQQLPQVKED